MQTAGLALVFGAENVPLLRVFLDSYLGCSRGGRESGKGGTGVCGERNTWEATFIH